MRTYEIPIQAGAGFVRQKVEIVRRKLVTAGEGQPTGSLTVSPHRESVSRMFPVSITLAAYGTDGDTSAAFPDRLVHVEPFKSALAAKMLVALPAEEEAKPPAPAPPVAPKSKVPARNEMAKPDVSQEPEATTADSSKTERPADAGTTTTKKRGGQ